MLKEWLLASPRDAELVQELLIVATELCTNAVRHGGPGVVTLRASEDDDGVVMIEVESPDRVGEATAVVRNLDDPFEEGGRGMLIVQALCDDVLMVVQDRHRVVRCRKRLGAMAQ